MLGVSVGGQGSNSARGARFAQLPHNACQGMERKPFANFFTRIPHIRRRDILPLIAECEIS